jgi:Mor family transcriptional regulator
MARQPMRVDTMLEARVMNRLQEMKGGQTIEQLQKHLKVSQSKIHAVLELYAKENHLQRSADGMWSLVTAPKA